MSRIIIPRELDRQPFLAPLRSIRPPRYAYSFTNGIPDVSAKNPVTGTLNIRSAAGAQAATFASGSEVARTTNNIGGGLAGGKALLARVRFNGPNNDYIYGFGGGTFALAYRHSSASYQWALWDGAVRSSGGSVLNIGQWYNLMVVMTPAGGSNSTLTFYEDGLVKNSGVSASLTDWGASPLSLNEYQIGGGLGGASDIALIAFFDYVPTDAECLDLTRNPWKIFQTVERDLYIFLGEAGGGTFNPAWAAQSNTVITQVTA